MSERVRRVRLWAGALPAWALTAALAVAYLILAPYSPDLAAASYRSQLFARSGFTLWDNSWYGGHHLPAYSIFGPALGSVIPPRLLAAVAMTLLAALFPLLARGRFPERAVRLASLWLALGAGVSLLSSRVPFDLGLAIGVGALILAQRGLLWPALVVSVLCALASPVAGAFLALVFLAWALAGPARGWPAALTLAALAPIGVLILVFPEGGSQPFAASAFYPGLLGVLVLTWLIPRERRTLRIGGLLYALALTGSYVLSTAMGANSDRLGSLFAGPVAGVVLAGTRPRLQRARPLLVLAPLLLYWQVNAPISDYAAVASNPAVRASYYAPLLKELQTLRVGYGARPVRIEAVPSGAHWEARWLAPHVLLARGWERQLDQYRNSLFYDQSTPLSGARYRAWLVAGAISYVALPDSTLDYSAISEGRLLRTGSLAYLREVWRSPHWRLFAVLGAAPLSQPPSVLQSITSDSLRVYAPRAGSYSVRVRFTPYWALASGDGCVERQPGAQEWTRIRARHAGSFHLVIRFSLARVLERGPRCT